MKKLEINITKAALKSFSVELKDGKPEVTASIALLTEGGKQITEYSIGTDSWQDDNKFELPVECVMPIVTLARQLEFVVTKHCRDSQLALPAYTPTFSKDNPIEEVITEDDQPIDLSDLPF